MKDVVTWCLIKGLGRIKRNNNNAVFLSHLNFLQSDCSLHLHLHVSENPYASGNIVSKDSAPGIIIASGLVCYVEWNCTLFGTGLLLFTFDNVPQRPQWRHNSCGWFPVVHFQADFQEIKSNGSLLHICSLFHSREEKNKNKI